MQRALGGNKNAEAGAKNEELGVASSWWESKDMAEWGIWIYTPPGA